MVIPQLSGVLALGGLGLFIFGAVAREWAVCRFNRPNRSLESTAEEAVKALIAVPVDTFEGDLGQARYDPFNGGVIRLPESAKASKTIAAVAVALHEAGHACQHARGDRWHQVWSLFRRPLCRDWSWLNFRALWIGVVLVSLGLWFFVSQGWAVRLALGAGALAVLIDCVVSNVLEFDATRTALGQFQSRRGVAAAVLWPAYLIYTGQHVMWLGLTLLAVTGSVDQMLSFLTSLLQF